MKYGRYLKVLGVGILLLLGIRHSVRVYACHEQKAFVKEHEQAHFPKINKGNVSEVIWDLAMLGYTKMLNDCQLENHKHLSIIDMSASANNKRFYLFDMEKGELIDSSLVAHGKNTGQEFANKFSNTVSSYQSSLGFYVTSETYSGKHGLSLRLDGMEPSNSNARKRAIVIHSADYVSESFIRKHGRLGRSFGCPALPLEGYDQIISKIKDGSCLFVYYPDQAYINSSPFLQQMDSSSAHI